MTTYTVKVKGSVEQAPTHLFGGVGIEIPFQSSLILWIELPREGEKITLYSYSQKDGGETLYGTLEPGESFAIPLRNCARIAAVAEHDTPVHCSVIVPYNS